MLSSYLSISVFTCVRNCLRVWVFGRSGGNHIILLAKSHGMTVACHFKKFQEADSPGTNMCLCACVPEIQGYFEKKRLQTK